MKLSNVNFSSCVLMCTSLLTFSFLPAYAVDPPVITPPTGVNAQPINVVTITGNPGDTISYSLDGSLPSIPYSSPVPIGNKTVVKAIATNGGVDSAVATSLILNDENTLPVPRSGLKLWLRGDFGVTVASGVSEWADLSSSTPANDATQATSGNRPTQVTAGLNGLNTVKFNSSNSQYLSLANGFTDLSTGATAFVVYKPSSSSTSTILTTGNSGPSDQFSLDAMNTQARMYAYAGSTASNLSTPSSSIALNNFQILDITHDGSAVGTINLNSAESATGALQNLANTTRNQNRIASSGTGSGFFDGEIAEILVWEKALTTKERADVAAYLTSRYQAPVSTSVASPIISVPSSTLAAPQEVAISAENGAAVHVTLDGSTPTSSSPVYSKPVSIIFSTTLKAIAIKNNISSAVSTASYSLDSTLYPAPDPLDTRPLVLNITMPQTLIP